MRNEYRCESIRLCRFLYSLGFDKKSIYINGQENWTFEKSEELQESLDFYFKMRSRLKMLRIKGVNEDANNIESKTMDTRGR